jgi:hypothetical protein
MYTASLAFRFVAMTLMLAHANWFCEKMDIPLERPITSENIKWAAPVFPGGFVGGAFTLPESHYRFGFIEGHLADFRIIGFMPDYNSEKSVFQKRVKELCLLKSQIDAQEALTLATNWLAKSGINMEKLLAESHHTVRQRSYRLPPEPGKLTPLEELKSPVFNIIWSRKDPNGNQSAEMIIDGYSKRLIYFHVGDRSLFQSLPLLIRDKERTERDYIEALENDPIVKEIEIFTNKVYDINYFTNKNIGFTEEEMKLRIEETMQRCREDADKYSYIKNLLSIPDEEFLKMDATQKSNLIKRFAPPESFPPQKKPEKAEYFEEKTEEKNKIEKNN